MEPWHLGLVVEAREWPVANRPAMLHATGKLRPHHPIEMPFRVRVQLARVRLKAELVNTRSRIGIRSLSMSRSRSWSRGGIWSGSGSGSGGVGVGHCARSLKDRLPTNPLLIQTNELINWLRQIKVNWAYRDRGVGLPRHRLLRHNLGGVEVDAEVAVAKLAQVALDLFAISMTEVANTIFRPEPEPEPEPEPLNSSSKSE